MKTDPEPEDGYDEDDLDWPSPFVGCVMLFAIVLFAAAVIAFFAWLLSPLA